jgi:hypothetical protein
LLLHLIPEYLSANIGPDWLMLVFIAIENSPFFFIGSLAKLQAIGINILLTVAVNGSCTDMLVLSELVLPRAMQKEDQQDIPCALVNANHS